MQGENNIESPNIDGSGQQELKITLLETGALQPTSAADSEHDGITLPSSIGGRYQLVQSLAKEREIRERERGRVAR